MVPVDVVAVKVYWSGGFVQALAHTIHIQAARITGDINDELTILTNIGSEIESAKPSTSREHVQIDVFCSCFYFRQLLSRERAHIITERPGKSCADVGVRS